MVHAIETSLRELLEGSKQYQVPLYQRTYSWQRAQFQRLWDDLVQLAEDRHAHGTAATHFMGSLVLAPTPDIGPAGVSRYLVVDGQQRLTTLTLLLAAVRDHRAESESPEHRDRLNEQYLINKWRQGPERLKLLPTQADRTSYVACLESSPGAGAADGIGEAYRYFRARLADTDDPDDEHDIARIEEAVLSGLTLVSVTTSHDDNVHRIFESLNNTGLRLTQGDLLRNYLFMRLPTKGPVVYETQWLPLQSRLSNDELELLFWLDAVQTDESVNQRDTYQAQVRRMDQLPDEAAVEAEVARFHALSSLLERILRPQLEADPDVRERLARLNAWGTTTVYPLLLHLLVRRERGEATSAEIAAAMLVVESYLIRRVLIGKATANLNRILLRAAIEITGKAPVDAAVRTYLSNGRKFFATDEQVRTLVRTVPFYYSGRSPQRKLILSWIEQLYGSKEPVDPSQCTVEHVMPQTSTPAWRSMIKEDVVEGETLGDVYDSLLHTLGNLTLTGYNSSLGNKSFPQKREAFKTSAFQMNKQISDNARWGRPEILKRAEDLAERVVAYWPGPDANSEESPMEQTWGLMNRALALVPAGSWTCYQAIAQLIGSHPVPVGQRVANHAVPNGHRVLQAAGTASPGFRWLDPVRTGSQREALEAEGVLFNAEGAADPAQMLSGQELAALVGVDLPDEELLPDADDGTGRHENFLAQLGEAQPPAVGHGVIALLDEWVHLGGRLQYGSAKETSCFLMIDQEGGQSVWPLTVYPSGRVEVVFQYLQDRPPFDSFDLRDEFRVLLNELEGIDLPASKLGMRPGFDLGALADPDMRGQLVGVLGWFLARLVSASNQQAPVDSVEI